MSWKMGKATPFQKPPSAPFHCGWTHALAGSLAKSHMFFSGKFCQSFHNTPSFDWRLFCRPPSFGWIRRQMSCFEGSVCHVLFKSFCRKSFLCGWTKLTGQEKKFVGERAFSLCLSPSPRFGWNSLCQVLCLTWGWLKKHSFGQWKNSPKPFSDVGFKQKTWINLGKSHISSPKCHTSWIRVIQPVSEIKAPKSWYGRIGTINIEMLHLDLKKGVINKKSTLHNLNRMSCRSSNTAPSAFSFFFSVSITTFFRASFFRVDMLKFWNFLTVVSFKPLSLSSSGSCPSPVVVPVLVVFGPFLARFWFFSFWISFSIGFHV